MDDEYSYDFGITGNKSNETKNADKVPINADKVPINADKLSVQYKLIIEFVEKEGKITSHQAEKLLNVKQRRAREILSKMADEGILLKNGAYKSTVYVLKKEGKSV